MLYVIIQSFALANVAKYNSGSLIKNVIQKVWKVNLNNLSLLQAEDLKTIFNTVKITFYLITSWKELQFFFLMWLERRHFIQIVLIIGIMVSNLTFNMTV